MDTHRNQLGHTPVYLTRIQKKYLKKKNLKTKSTLNAALSPRAFDSAEKSNQCGFPRLNSCRGKVLYIQRLFLAVAGGVACGRTLSHPSETGFWENSVTMWTWRIYFIIKNISLGNHRRSLKISSVLLGFYLVWGRYHERCDPPCYPRGRPPVHPFPPQRVRQLEIPTLK